MKLAGKGTVFIDEIGDLDLETQAMFLRALQERQFKPVGGSDFIDLEAKIVCATNADLEQMIEQGKFRKELYYRINAFQTTLPPLRQRADRIALFHDMVKRHCDGCSLSSDALHLLQQYEFEGNIRQAENILRVTGIFVKADGRTSITANDLLPQLMSSSIHRKVIVAAPSTVNGNEVHCARAS